MLFWKVWSLWVDTAGSARVMTAAATASLSMYRKVGVEGVHREVRVNHPTKQHRCQLCQKQSQ